jgi:hypothetical protein
MGLQSIILRPGKGTFEAHFDKICEVRAPLPKWEMAKVVKKFRWHALAAKQKLHRGHEGDPKGQHQ